MLRVEALWAAGRREEARISGARFVETHPSSSYAPRIRALLERIKVIDVLPGGQSPSRPGAMGSPTHRVVAWKGFANARLRSLTAWLLGASLGIVAIPRPAFADAIPPQDCADSDNGQPCTIAGPNANEDGTCVQTSCLDFKPELDAGVTSTCVVCLLPGTDAGPSSVLNPCEQVSGACVAVARAVAPTVKSSPGTVASPGQSASSVVSLRRSMPGPRRMRGPERTADARQAMPRRAMPRPPTAARRREMEARIKRSRAPRGAPCRSQAPRRRILDRRTGHDGPRRLHRRASSSKLESCKPSISRPFPSTPLGGRRCVWRRAAAFFAACSDVVIRALPASRRFKSWSSWGSRSEPRSPSSFWVLSSSASPISRPTSATWCSGGLRRERSSRHLQCSRSPSPPHGSEWRCVLCRSGPAKPSTSSSVSHGSASPSSLPRKDVFASYSR